MLTVVGATVSIETTRTKSLAACLLWFLPFGPAVRYCQAKSRARIKKRKPTITSFTNGRSLAAVRIRER